MCVCVGVFVSILTHNPSPNPLASIGPKLKPTPRHLLFATTTVGAHRGAGSGACRANFGRDLLHRLRRAPRVVSRGLRSPGHFIKFFVTGTNVVNRATVSSPCLWLARRLYINTAAALAGLPGVFNRTRGLAWPSPLPASASPLASSPRRLCHVRLRPQPVTLDPASLWSA